MSCCGSEHVQRFRQPVPYGDYLRAFSQRIPVRWPKAAPNLEPRDDIWPTDMAPYPQIEGRIYQLRWGFPPAKTKGRRSSISARRSGAFPKGRCLVPASHFFEFTGTKSPKTKWKFTKTGEDWFCFAGLWRPMPEGGAAFTLLTTEPGPDVAPIHDRQMVILERDDWSAWLDMTRPEAELLRRCPPAACEVEQVGPEAAPSAVRSHNRGDFDRQPVTPAIFAIGDRRDLVPQLAVERAVKDARRCANGRLPDTD